MAVDVGMAVLRLATERWVLDERADFSDLSQASARDLYSVTADIRDDS